MTPTRETITHDGFDLGVRLADGTVFEFCSRCGGCGHYSFNPQDGTRCYGCNGSGLGKATTEADMKRRYENRKKAAHRRARQAERKAADARLAAETWREDHEPLMVALMANAEDDTFLGDLLAQTEHRPLSEAQVEAAWPAIERARQRRSEQQAQREVGHFGTVGEKFTGEVEIVKTRYFDTAFNGRPVTKAIVTMRDGEGHVLKTFTTGRFGWDVEEGQTVKITGKVKEHGEYQGLPETTLERVKAL